MIWHDLDDCFSFENCLNLNGVLGEGLKRKGGEFV